MATAVARQQMILPPDEGAKGITARTKGFQRCITRAVDACFGWTGIVVLDPAYRATLSARDRAEIDAFLWGGGLIRG